MEQLECGCLFSEGGGGKYIPCEASGLYDFPGTMDDCDPEKRALHEKCMKEYNESTVRNNC